MTTKRIGKKKYKRFIATMAVLTSNEIDYQMKRPSIVQVVCGVVDAKQYLKENGHDPLTAENHDQRVKKMMKKVRFRNKWKP